MCAHLPKAGEVLVIRQVVEQRSKRRDHEREALAQVEGAHVRIDNLDARANVPGLVRELLAKRGEHPRIAVERVNGDAILGEFQRDAPGAGTELEHRPTALARLATVPVDVAKERCRYGGVVDRGIVAAWHEKSEHTTRCKRGFRDLRILNTTRSRSFVRTSGSVLARG